VALLKNRSFIILATYPIITNVLVDYSTPYIYLAINPSDKKVIIKRYTYLVTIYKYEIDVTFFVTSAKNTFIALIIVVALGGSYTLIPEAAYIVPNGNLLGIIPLIPKEFTLK
jgi:hypothetical protein